jgi:hypothetical protein
MTDEEGPLAVKGAAMFKTATYRWKLDGKNLSFTKVKDLTVVRASVMTSRAWEKKE